MYHFSKLHGPFIKLKELGESAQKFYQDDPNIALIKIRQFGEDYVKLVAARENFTFPLSEEGNELTQELKIKQLYVHHLIPEIVNEKLHQIRKMGNKAAHETSFGNVPTAHKALHLASEVSEWLIVQYKLQPVAKQKPPQKQKSVPTTSSQASQKKQKHRNRNKHKKTEAPQEKRLTRNEIEAREKTKSQFITVSLIVLILTYVEFYGRLFIQQHYNSNFGNSAIIDFTNSFLVIDTGQYIFAPLIFILPVAAILLSFVAMFLLRELKHHYIKVQSHTAVLLIFKLSIIHHALISVIQLWQKLF
ncbi:DUF4145 domain-containing protein [Caryophanon latum]|uniref:DUF4145 domain-containing protein n=1 Tax=Caryophanon latum TaxID=33977 RepID=A0A1C0Z2Y7_9BACL|nr:DUF4145 domain-containing protein [Caryophanon latum]OCS93748.1 hypothetical protein A6K76_04410 [Caryophanon latum]